jgi:SAM-dependent methyltransferase
MTTTDTPTPTSDVEVEAFVGKVLTDSSAWLATTLAMIGDRLGLWSHLGQGAATSAELATRAGVDERYAREWLHAMTAHGYLTFETDTSRFQLPEAHRPALADEGGPMFFGGVHQEMLGLLPAIEPLLEAFRHGGGVSQSTYSNHFWDGLARFTAGWFNNLLLQQWLPAMPEVEAALERGCDVADIGCGQGRALVKLAQRFPGSRYVGYDIHQRSIDAARGYAAANRVADRVRFELHDATTGLPEQYDLITTFDVVHDATDPRGLLRAIHAALRHHGRYICLDINASHRHTDNTGPLGTFFYGFSILYCMTVSLANHGAGLGTCGFNEPTVRGYCADAGFSTVRRVPLDNPFNILYEISR